MILILAELSGINIILGIQCKKAEKAGDRGQKEDCSCSKLIQLDSYFHHAVLSDYALIFISMTGNAGL